MQIEIPDLEDDSLTSHRRHGSNTTTGLSFPNFTTTTANLSASRPFGGQHPTTSAPLSRRPSANQHILTNNSNNNNEQTNNTNIGIRRNPSINHHNPLHQSPSSPSLNSAYHHQAPPPPPPPPLPTTGTTPATTSRTTHRKLSVASLRSGINNSKSNPNQRNQNEHPPNQIPSSPFPASPNPMSAAQSGSQNGRFPRTRNDPSTTNSSHSTTGSPQLDHHPPLEVAIFLIMDRFFEECESKLAQLLSKPIPTHSVEDDVYIPYCLGHGVDPAFDATFISLAQVSKKNPAQVVNFVMRWKSRQGELNDDYAIQRALVTSGNSLNARRVTAVLSERKNVSQDEPAHLSGSSDQTLSLFGQLALVYILCRALISIVQVVTREALGEELGTRLEEIIFNSIKNADP
ncbi:Cell morphoproteinsis protein PAG1 [Puccinia graminis f. sp. tritici]|uniref:Cell morphoproteinsis protein PAG1 n=1 Tax=Puccinia graminis f. sp. tritici TaxID=56615 RepID=A0A5B0LMA1_PUCGR|nr:Cell morphoproteinsis protein PAG1 [Puccinia graminis f. sp. tritici]KAA1068108.1 Cell morphoproteinsis protein PAG1 [Puccinia graminis f. sp. tritici]